MMDESSSAAREANRDDPTVLEPRRSSRTRAPRRERPRPAEDAIILYRIGPVTRRVRHELEPLLEAFHANAEIQAQCRIAQQNASEYMRLQETGDECSYVAAKRIPAGTRLAAYSGFVREEKPGNTRRRHDMHLGDPGIGFNLVVDGSPGLSAEDDARPGRLQMIDHACSPYNNCIETRVICEDSMLPAYFVESIREIAAGQLITFEYQQVHLVQGRQVFYPNDFWQNAATLPRQRRDQRLIVCRCAQHLRKACPNGYGRLEPRSRRPPAPTHPHPPLPPPPPHHPPSPPPHPPSPPPPLVQPIAPPPPLPPAPPPPPPPLPRFSLQPPPPADSPPLPTLITLNVGPVGLADSFASLLPIFEELPMAVLFQEAHLSSSALPAFRRTVHAHLPLYSVFATRTKRQKDRIQVITFVHAQVAARASLLNIAQELEEARSAAPESNLQVHFLRLIHPMSGVSMLLVNCRQYQASQTQRQAAMLSLITKVIKRWEPQSDYVLVGGDFNATLRPRIGYSGIDCIRVADSSLLRWCSEGGFTCAAPEQHTWSSFNESRLAALDSFFWKSNREGESVFGATAFDSTDPRLDHRGVRVYLQIEGVGPMPPLEALYRPRRLRMANWQSKKQEWQQRVTSTLELEGSGHERDLFEQLDHIKRMALDQARSLLGTTGGRIRSLIPHHSEQFKKLTARLSLLKVVRREVTARRDTEHLSLPPTKAMRRVWDAGLYPKPAEFAILSAPWSTQNREWTVEWLRFLRQQSYSLNEELQLVRHSELTAAADRSRKDAVSKFYTGGELRKLLNPSIPSLHTPMLRTAMPDCVHVRGGRDVEAMLRIGLVRCEGVAVRPEAEGSVLVSGIRPSDLCKVLCFAQERNLAVLTLSGVPRLVFSATDRLAAWEYLLASEAMAKTSKCSQCMQPSILPVTRIDGGKRTVLHWCNHCSSLIEPSVPTADYERMPFNTEGIPRVPNGSGASLRGPISSEDFEHLLRTLPRKSAPGDDQLPYELLTDAPAAMKAVIHACLNSLLQGETRPPTSWLGGVVRFLFKRGDLADPSNYRPVCLQETVYKLLTAILTDRLYRLAERYGLLDPAQEGFRKLHSTLRQAQSLHWSIKEVSEREGQVYVVYLDFSNAFNSVDVAALWAWLRHLNIPDIDILQSLYEGAHYVADLPYGRSATVTLTRGTKQGDKLSPLLFSLVFNALLLALKKTGVGYRTIQGLRSSSRGFADDLVLVTGSSRGMGALLQVVSNFCAWTGMQVNLAKSVITAFDHREKRDLPTEAVLFDGQPLVHLSADASFKYLGIRASLVRKGKRKDKLPVPCCTEEKKHIFASTRELVTLSRNHKFLFRQMVPAMHMVATSRFRYSAPLVAWTDADLDKLHTVWLQVHKASWRVPPSFASAPLTLPSENGGCPVEHPRVHLIQALAGHIEQLVALPDELRETTRRQYQRLCESCGCHTAQELAEFLLREQSPRPCPIARLLRACAQLDTQIRLPACLSLGKVERETSWHALLKHIQGKVEEQEDEQKKQDLGLVTQSWSAIRRRWRRRGIRFPRQLVLDPRQTPAFWLIPQQLKPSPRWLEPLRRLLREVDTFRLFPRLDRGLGTPAPSTHQQLLHDVIAGLKSSEVPVATLFEDSRWSEVRSLAPVRSWRESLIRRNIICHLDVVDPAGVDPIWDLVGLGTSGECSRGTMLDLTICLAPSLRDARRADVVMEDTNPLTWEPLRLQQEGIEFVHAPRTNVANYGSYTVISKDNLSRIERDGEYLATINQSRLGMLVSAFESLGLDVADLFHSIPHWITEVERGEASRGIGSAQFWHGVQKALNADRIVGCDPLTAPAAFPSASPDGVYLCWGQGDSPKRPVFNLLTMCRSFQRGLLPKLTASLVWFAVTRRSSLDTDVARALKREGQVVAHYRTKSVVAACKGHWRSAKLRAVQCQEGWYIWASRAAVSLQGEAATLKTALASIPLSRDGVVPLDQTAPSYREASFGPAAAAYSNRGVVVATDGSLRKDGAMGAAYVSKDNKLQARSVAVFGRPASILPELAGIALPLEDCPLDEELSVLTDSQSAMDLLRSLQRADFPRWLHRHPARQLLRYVVTLLNRRASAGSVTRLVKVKAHRAEPLNEAADAMAFAAAEMDPARPAELDPEAVYFRFKESLVQWDARLRRELVQRAAKRCMEKMLRPRRGQEGHNAVAAATSLPLTATWLLREGQGRRLLGKALAEMDISPGKRQVIRSIAGAFPCNALLAKWYPERSAACALCGHATETQSHIQCLCPALKDARIRAHHNLAEVLWTGIRAAGQDWVIEKELTVLGLQGLNPPSNRIAEWYRALDEVTDEQLDAEVGEEEASPILRKRPDAWAVSWEERKLFIMEFTRPNDKDSDFSLSTDRTKSDRYLPLRERLSQLLPEWEVDVLPFTVGIRGTLDEAAWKARLGRLGVQSTAAERLMLAMVKTALTELIAIYNCRAAALSNQLV